MSTRLMRPSWRLAVTPAITLLPLLLLVLPTAAAEAQDATAGQGPLGRTAAERAAARASSRASAIPGRPGLGDSAVVEDKVVRIRIPRPVSTEEPGIPSMVGYYVWQLAMAGPDPFTIVLMADTAMQTTALNAILAASSLRRCPDAMPRGLRDCTTPIDVRIRFDDEAIELTVRDADFVARLRQSRPLSYTRSTIEPHGRVQSAEKMLVYLDRKPERFLD